MMQDFMESVDRRVLGGFVFIDAITGRSIQSPLPVTSDVLRLKANRNGMYAIFNGPGFVALTAQFIPNTPWPAPQAFEISVKDPDLHYLARRAQINAPQQLAGAFSPQQVTLYPGPGSTVEANWAVVHASVRSTADAGLPWAIIQVRLGDGTVAATGMADARGEALLAVAGLGIQVTSHATDPVTVATTPVTLQAWFDANVLTKPKNWVPNPDDILGNLANPSLKTGTNTGVLGARQTSSTTITISV